MSKWPNFDVQSWAITGDFKGENYSGLLPYPIKENVEGKPLQISHFVIKFCYHNLRRKSWDAYLALDHRMIKAMLTKQ